MATNPTLHVRGSVDIEKYKAARTLGGDAVKFQLRAMRPAGMTGTAAAAPSCLVCIICIICIVCSVATAKENGLPALPPL
jgi:hypothetical protein